MTALIQRGYRILIHTSVKLVTQRLNVAYMELVILIHTSVKLVTYDQRHKNPKIHILIHTSVKLVTGDKDNENRTELYFNPHEREARDVSHTPPTVIQATF